MSAFHFKMIKKEESDDILKLYYEVDFFNQEATYNYFIQAIGKQIGYKSNVYFLNDENKFVNISGLNTANVNDFVLSVMQACHKHNLRLAVKIFKEKQEFWMHYFPFAPIITVLTKKDESRVDVEKIIPETANSYYQGLWIMNLITYLSCKKDNDFSKITKYIKLSLLEAIDELTDSLDELENNKDMTQEEKEEAEKEGQTVLDILNKRCQELNLDYNITLDFIKNLRPEIASLEIK